MEYDFIQCPPRAVFDTSTLSGTYQALNSTGFGSEVKAYKIYNGSTTGVDVSYDGVTDHDYFPAGATQILDCQTNHACQSSTGTGTKVMRKNQIVYGKGTAGTGNLYIIGYY